MIHHISSLYVRLSRVASKSPYFVVLQDVLITRQTTQKKCLRTDVACVGLATCHLVLKLRHGAPSTEPADAAPAFAEAGGPPWSPGHLSPHWAELRHRLRRTPWHRSHKLYGRRGKDAYSRGGHGTLEDSSSQKKAFLFLDNTLKWFFFFVCLLF